MFPDGYYIFDFGIRIIICQTRFAMRVALDKKILLTV
jgi:hypothetical protein